MSAATPVLIAGRRVLIAAVGYRNLRDMSVAHEVLPALQQMEWPPEVEFDDLSFGPIAIVQRFQAQPGYFDRLVLISAVERGRPPGSVHRYRWAGDLPDAEEIQQRVGEAVTGVISLDNLLIVAQHFGALPPDVEVVEVEPEDTGWGPGFTDRVAAALPEVMAAVRRAALGE